MSNTAFGPLWTPAEDEILRALYPTAGSRPVAEKVGRSTASVRHRAYELGVVRNRRWSFKDDRELQMSWGPLTIVEIAKKMGRTPTSIYWRARQLGLGLGCPQGYEYLSDAAVRTGYATGQLRRICRWAGVGVTRAMVRPDIKAKTRHTHHIVVPFDVDEAIARWCATEPIEAAARRHGYCGDVVRRLVLAAIAKGDKRLDAPPKNGAHWRVPSVVVDELFAASSRLETLEAASARIGVNRRTLHGWLNTAGVVVRRGIRLDPADVDRVVAERNASMTLQDAAREFGRSHPWVHDIVRQAIARGELVAPPRRPGSPWRLPRAELRALITAHLEGKSGRRPTPRKTQATTDNEITQVA